MVEALISTQCEEIASCRRNRFNSSQLMVPNHILWPSAPAQQTLGATDVHIWAANLDLSTDALGRFSATLSKDEQERAAKFHFERHRNRFIAGRGILRSMLARYLDSQPEAVQFCYSPNGKPALCGRFAKSGLTFNLAHSENLALFAVARVSALGIDVEKIRPVTDANELVARFFSARENALFEQLAQDQKTIAFLNLWTRKEAWLKATGEGIGHLLAHVEVTFLPGEPARFLALPQYSALNANWFVRELRPAAGFVGAIALPDIQPSIVHFQYSTEAS
jgi:4'-phosphopantetheinyl transferase